MFNFTVGIHRVVFKYVAEYSFVTNCWTCTHRKKGTKTVPLGYYFYKWYPFYKGALFFP